MIQSRPQFGYIGALLVWLFAYLQYAGFNIFNTMLAGDAVGGAISSGHGGEPALVLGRDDRGRASIALVGYDLIHSFERYLTYPDRSSMLALLTIVGARAPAPARRLRSTSRTSTPSPFFGQLGVVAGYQISWAIYVSDYSRYLPPTTSTRSDVPWTFWGSALGGIWMMFLGSWIAVSAKDIGTERPSCDLKHVADMLFPGFGAIALIIAALGLISVTALNMYGGSLTLISSIDSFATIRPTLVDPRHHDRGHRRDLDRCSRSSPPANFLGDFADFLLLVLYLFIPWTAVNLTDYFIVRRGHYAIAEIFKPNGIYRRWGWAGIVRLPPRLRRA